MSHLVLVRHGTSEWNKQGLWTGWTDVSLAEEGVVEARRLAALIRDIPLDRAHVSKLLRAQQTLDHLLDELELELPTSQHEALNERHYGIHTGKNKWQVRDLVGEEAFQKIRRGWDEPIPEGESLKQVSERVVPYFTSTIEPELKRGQNVIVVAHGNSLRSLIKHLENLPDEAIADVEVGHGEAHCYRLHADGTWEKEIRRLGQTLEK